MAKRSILDQQSGIVGKPRPEDMTGDLPDSRAPRKKKKKKKYAKHNPGKHSSGY